MLVLILISCLSSRPEPLDHFGYTFLSYDTVQWYLDPVLEETSGLLKVDESYWTHNDSGNDPALYQFDPEKGNIVRTFRLNNVKNVDWEDVAQDQTHIYIGDFGNNLGNRGNLAIYRLPKSVLDTAESCDVERIQFNIPEQAKFANSYNHNFDVESLIAYRDSLFFFTKNWEDKKCQLYGIPKAPGTYQAKYISSLNTKGLITSATYNEENNVVVLLGYNYNKVNTPFVWILSNFKGQDFFSGSRNRYNLDLNRQTEAICYESENQYLFSAEQGNDQSASTFRINL